MWRSGQCLNHGLIAFKKSPFSLADVHLRNLSLFLYTLLHSGDKIKPNVAAHNCLKSVTQPRLSM